MLSEEIKARKRVRALEWYHRNKERCRLKRLERRRRELLADPGMEARLRREYCAKHPDRVKASNNKYNETHRDQRRKKAGEWYQKNRQRASEWKKAYVLKNKEKIAAEQKAYYMKNRETLLQYDVRYQQENREYISERGRKYRLRSNYGLTLEAYQEIWDAQFGKCCICDNELKKSLNRSPAVDHDHKTGAVRGILCFACNTRLGWYEKYSSNVISYLSRSPVSPGVGTGARVK